MSLRESVAELVKNAPPPTDRARVLADLAEVLAGRLDDGCDDRYAAGVAKELRSTVDALEAAGGVSDAFDELAQRLSATVGDTPD